MWQPNRVEVLPKGLEGAIEGMKQMEEMKVSGTKLVFRVAETP